VGKQPQHLDIRPPSEEKPSWKPFATVILALILVFAGIGVAVAYSGLEPGSRVSSTLKYLGQVGAIFSVLSIVLWVAARQTETLMREDVKEGFAEWLKSTPFDKPFRDWCYSFTGLFDSIFGIETTPRGFGLPRLSRAVVFGVLCPVVVFAVFGQGKPVMDEIGRLFQESDFAQRYPQFVRSIIADIGLMMFVLLLLNILASYVSIIKSRVILSRFA
jgi:hypothetical protein